MSMVSYEDKVSRRITGPNKPHCFPASGECVSPNQSYPDWIYPYYDEFNQEFFSQPKRIRETKMLPDYREMLDTLFWPLGGLSCEDVRFRRARTVMGLKRILHQAVENEDRILVDVKDGRHEIHVLGLIAIEGRDLFVAVGNHVPQRYQGILTPERLAPKLHQPNEPYNPNYTWNTSNVTLLPAA